MSQIIAKKKGESRSFTLQQWKLLPSHRFGWVRMADKPKEVVEFEVKKEEPKPEAVKLPSLSKKTIAELKAIALGEGIEITKTKRADIVSEINNARN